MQAGRLLLVAVGLLGLAVLASAIYLSTAAAGREATAAPTATPGPSVTPAPGEMRVSLRLPAGSAPVAEVRAGDTITLLGFFPSQGALPATTRPLLPKVLVLQAMRQAEAEVLQLSVAPGDALLLQQAEQLGVKPFAVLRSASDGGSAGLTSVTDADATRWLISRPGTGR